MINVEMSSPLSLRNVSEIKLLSVVLSVVKLRSQRGADDVVID